MNLHERIFAAIVIAIIFFTVASDIHIGIAVLALIFILVPTYMYVDMKLEKRRKHEKK